MKAGISFLAIPLLLAAGPWASGYRERDSAYAAAGADCRKALARFPRDIAFEVATSRYVCGPNFTYYSQQELDKMAPGDTATDPEAKMLARSKSRRSLIAFGYDHEGKIEIRGDSVTVWRRYLHYWKETETDPRQGRLSAAEVKTLDTLIAAAPGGIFVSNLLRDVQGGPMWISAAGKKLLVVHPGITVWGEPLKDIANLSRFLRAVSDRIAGKAVNRFGPTPEDLKALEAE